LYAGGTVLKKTIAFIIAFVVLASIAAFATPNEDLLRAVRVGSFRGVSEALKEGANVNHRDPDNYDATVLIIAAHRGLAEVVELLISKGADVNATDKTYGITALSLAVKNQDLQVVRLLTAKGANVNQGNKEGVTPLYLATKTGNADIVQDLVDRGARVNQPSGRGATPCVARWARA